MKKIAVSLLLAASLGLAACEGPEPTPPDAPNVEPAPGGGGSRDGENTKEVSLDVQVVGDEAPVETIALR